MDQLEYKARVDAARLDIKQARSKDPADPYKVPRQDMPRPGDSFMGYVHRGNMGDGGIYESSRNWDVARARMSNSRRRRTPRAIFDANGYTGYAGVTNGPGHRGSNRPRLSNRY